MNAPLQSHRRNDGEIVVSPRSVAHGGLPESVIEKLGLSGIGDLGNVVPFRRLKPTPADAPACVVSLQTRPAPLPPRLSSRRFWLSLAVTLAAHAVAFGAFFREPPPLPSIGVEVMSVEIVVGTNSLAGKIDPTSKSEVTVQPPVEEKIAEEITQPPDVSDKTQEPAQLQERAKDEPVKLAAVEPAPQPIEPPKAAEPQPVAPAIVPEHKVEQPPEPRPQPIVEQALEKAVEPEKPVEQQVEKPVVAALEPETPAKPAEIKPVETRPVETKPAEIKREPVTPVETKRPEPQKKQDVKAATSNKEKPTQAPKNDRAAAAPAATPQREARGAGIGRSDADTNYPGLFRAHLMRFKPPFSEFSGGHATLEISLTASGGLVGVRLVSGSGNPRFDEIALSMARRAAPYPAPGAGRTMRVPLNFNR